jgi:heme/copper-type cytochrome/quinol oxidase subunit 3
MTAPGRRADKVPQRDRARLRRIAWPLLLVLAALGVVAALASVVGEHGGMGGVSVWPLAAFVWAMIVYVVTRLPAHLAAPHRLQQAAYVALLPLSATVFLAAFYVLWGHLGVAVILGACGGVIVQAAFNPAIVGSATDAPDCHRAESVERSTPRHVSRSVMRSITRDTRPLDRGADSVQR